MNELFHIYEGAIHTYTHTHNTHVHKFTYTHIHEYIYTHVHINGQFTHKYKRLSSPFDSSNAACLMYVMFKSTALYIYIYMHVYDAYIHI